MNLFQQTSENRHDTEIYSPQVYLQNIKIY